MLDCAGLAARVGGLDDTVWSVRLVFAVLEVQLILKAVPAGDHVKVLGRILRGTGAQAVQTQRKLIIFAAVVAVFAAGIQLAINQFPVVALFLFIIVQRHTAAEVLHLDGAVQIPGNIDHISVALSGLVNGVR